MPIPTNDREVLKYAGWLGHTHVVVVDDGGGFRRCPYQCSSKKRAVKAAKEDYAKLNPAIYQQVKSGEWKPVPLPKGT